MDNKELLNKLLEIAEMLDIRVIREKRLIVNGICKSYGKDYVVLNNNMPIDDQILICIKCLKTKSLENIYIIPEIRKIIED